MKSVLPEGQTIDHRAWRGDDWEYTVSIDFDQDTKKDILFGDYFGNTFELTNSTNPQRALPLVQQWGAVLATSHARADQDSSPLIPYDFEKELLGKITTDKQRLAFLARVRQVAFFYAKQVSEDYKSFKEWQSSRAQVAGKE